MRVVDAERALLDLGGLEQQGLGLSVPAADATMFMVTSRVKPASAGSCALLPATKEGRVRIMAILRDIKSHFSGLPPTPAPMSAKSGPADLLSAHSALQVSVAAGKSSVDMLIACPDETAAKRPSSTPLH